MKVWGFLGCGVADVGRVSRRSQSGGCPRCGADGSCERFRAVRAVRLFGMPIIPLRRVGVVDACRSCGRRNVISNEVWNSLYRPTARSATAMGSSPSRQTDGPALDEGRAAAAAIAARQWPAQLVIVGLVLILGLGTLAVVRLTARRAVLLVSGLPIRSTVEIDERTFVLGPDEIREITLASGRHRVVCDGQTFGRSEQVIEIPWTLRSPRPLVLNADGMAVAVVETVSYDTLGGRTGTTSQAFRGLRGLTRTDDVNHLFEDAPAQHPNYDPTTLSGGLIAVARGGGTLKPPPDRVQMNRLSARPPYGVDLSLLDVESRRRFEETMFVRVLRAGDDADWFVDRWNWYFQSDQFDATRRLALLRKHLLIEPIRSDWVQAWVVESQRLGAELDAALLSQLRTDHPDSTASLFAMGSAQTSFEDAKPWFERAVQNDSGDAVARRALVRGLLATGQFEEAIPLTRISEHEWSDTHVPSLQWIDTDWLAARCGAGQAGLIPEAVLTAFDEHHRRMPDEFAGEESRVGAARNGLDISLNRFRVLAGQPLADVDPAFLELYRSDFGWPGATVEDLNAAAAWSVAVSLRDRSRAERAVDLVPAEVISSGSADGSILPGPFERAVITRDAMLIVWWWTRGRSPRDGRAAVRELAAETLSLANTGDTVVAGGSVGVSEFKPPPAIRDVLRGGTPDWPRIEDTVIDFREKAAALVLIGRRRPELADRAFAIAERLNVLPDATGLLIAEAIADARAGSGSASGGDSFRGDASAPTVAGDPVPESSAPAAAAPSPER